MNCNSIRIASVSDIHLGHPDNDADEIADKLIRAFPDNEETAALDIIGVMGDLFDSLLSFPNVGVSAAYRFAAHLLYLGKKHDILIRFLEGTPLHDWKQSSFVLELNRLAEFGADLKYVDDLHIEHIERYGITVLYVPDKLVGGPQTTLSRVKQLLKDNNLEQVDFAFMHGCFKFQLPSSEHDQCHDEVEYLKFVKHEIYIGHHHTFTHFDRIIGQGSFDRLSHGQEEAKGHVRTVTYPDGQYDLTFVENKDAKRFVTVLCHGLDPARAIEVIDNKVRDLPEGSYVRVLAEAGNSILTDRVTLNKRYPFFEWKTEADKVKKKKADAMEVVLEQKFIPVAIHKDNIESLLLGRIKEKHSPDDYLLQVAGKVLRGVMNDR